MHKDSFDFVYNAEGDYYDLVVDKKIQKVVEELKALPHDVLIRYLTYWSEAIDSRKYVVESDFPHEEWYTDCCDYAASETDEERYMHAKCMAETLGHMLQDIKNNSPNKYPAAMRTVKSWKNYSFIGFTPTMREEIDKAWIEPNTWNDGKKAAMAFVPLLEVFMKQYEEGKNEEAAGNAFYLLERLARLHCKDVDYFEPDRESHCSYYEFLLEAVCHILTLVMKDKRTEQRYRNAMVWHINTINMLYGQKHDKEIESAKAVAKWYGVPYYEMDMSAVMQYSDCPLLKHSHKAIKHESYSDQLMEMGGKGTVDTYVPFRNGLFLSAAAAFALSVGATKVYYGAHADDAAGSAYPDCSEKFAEAMNQAIEEGSGGAVKLVAPLITMTKGEVVHAGLSLKAPYHLTWSCYEGGDTPCGECATCIDRARAFAENGVTDPALITVKQNDGVTRLEHHQKLSDIHFDFDLQLYCPQGNEHYTAQMSVDMVPGKYLPDYIELDKEFRHGCGKDLIIEDAVEWVFNLIQSRYAPAKLRVEAEVKNAVHFDVRVGKESEGYWA